MEENNYNTPNNIHIDRNQQPKLPKSAESVSVHVNPKMLTTKDKLGDNGQTPGNMYINPDFINRAKVIPSHIKSRNTSINAGPSQYSNVIPHINPNFQKLNKNSSAGNILDASITFKSSVHVNPNFVGRRLPSPPISSASCTRLPEQFKAVSEDTSNSEPTYISQAHINPKFVDALKTKAYDEAIKKAVKNNDHLSKKVELNSQSANLNKPKVSNLKVSSNSKKYSTFYNIYL